MATVQICGIADEAGQDIETQVKAHTELGWDLLELRLVDGRNATDLTDDEFDRVYAAVTEAGLHVPSFASQLCNWARPITTDFAVDVAELRRAIPRMQRLGAKTIRIMSYPNDKDNPLPEAEWRKEALRRIRELVKMAEDGGIVLVHENCHGWACRNTDAMLELVEEIPSPSLKLLFDMGNFSGKPVGASREMYSKIREHIAYVHMKDRGDDGATFPGQGNCEVRRITQDLAATGYDGIISIEPHIAAVVHLGKTSDPQLMYETYIKYGRMAAEIVEEANAVAG